MAEMQEEIQRVAALQPHFACQSRFDMDCATLMSDGRRPPIFKEHQCLVTEVGREWCHYFWSGALVEVFENEAIRVIAAHQIGLTIGPDRPEHRGVWARAISALHGSASLESEAIKLRNEFVAEFPRCMKVFFDRVQSS